MKYGQSQLDISDEMDLVADKAKYDADRAKDIDLGGPHGIAQVMASEHLDALLFPGRERRGDLRRNRDIRRSIVPFARIPKRADQRFLRGSIRSRCRLA